MTESERRCQKLKTGKVEFTLDNNKVLAAASYWQMTIKRMNGRQINRRAFKTKWKQMAPKYKIDPRTMNIAQAHCILKAIRANIKLRAKNSQAKREEFLERLSLDLEKHDNLSGKPRRSYITALKNEEKQRQINWAIKAALPNH